MPQGKRKPDLAGLSVNSRKFSENSPAAADRVKKEQHGRDPDKAGSGFHGSGKTTNKRPKFAVIRENIPDFASIYPAPFLDPQSCLHYESPKAGEMR